MGAFEIFVLRVMLSVGFAFLACRIFFKGATWISVLGLAAILLGLAYGFEYLKKRDDRESNG